MRLGRVSWMMLVVACLLGGGSARVSGQREEKGPALTEREVEKIRDAAYIPGDKLRVFGEIVDTRTARIHDLVTKPRKPGREAQLHELMRQVGDIVDELNDNLQGLSRAKRDVRKSLPAVVEATERWATALRSTADDPSYRVARRIALDAVADLQESAKTVLAEQTEYFKAHPEAALAEKQRLEAAPQ